jgi:ferric-dicitrate binding protein FerR (iron transport regulator)
MSEKENIHIDYNELIPKYLSGNADSGEVNSLEEWVLASEENKNQFMAFKKAWILSGSSNKQNQIDVDKEWNSFKTKINTENVRNLKIGQRYNFRHLARYAAVLIFIIASTFGLYKVLNTEKPTTIIAQKSKKTDNLPDGSQVTLNHNSEISYSISGKSKTRNVELKGEAFFEVTRDTNRVFNVNAEDITVEVLGTEFYVDARKDQPQITVIVHSGTVSVKSATEEIILNANEVGFYDKGSRILLKSQNTDVNYMSWNTGVLIFEKTDLERVVYDLNRKYNSNIKIENQELKSCRITATFNNKSLDAIIKIIEKTLKIKSVVRDGEILLTGEGCN